MARQYFAAPVGNGAETDGNQAVVVPLNRKPLAPTSSDRVRRLRRHLIASLRGMRRMKDPVGSASPLRPEPEGFIGHVARTACSLCRGSCCKGGGEHAYLDEWTIARVRHARSELEASKVLQLYIKRVPSVGYEGSCIFHGEAGCTLDRSLRSDVCNSHFCTGLGNFVESGEAAASVVVIAGEGDEMRLSPVLTP